MPSEGNGGSFGDLDVPRDLDIAAVYIPPGEAGDAAFHEAASAFDELSVTAVEFDHTQALGEAAASRLAASVG